MWQSIYHIAKICKTFLSVKNSRDFFTYLRIKKSHQERSMLLAKREKEIPYSPMFVIMKLNEVWFRTFLNIQDTKLNLKNSYLR